jgi:hypothetical protein
MKIENDRQLINTEGKLKLIEQQIESAKTRPATPQNDESLRSLVAMADQLRSELREYRSLRQRQAS